MPVGGGFTFVWSEHKDPAGEPCVRSGHKVLDFDYGFMTSRGIVPEWEFYGSVANDGSSAPQS